MTSCVVCSSARLAPFAALYDDRYGYPGVYRVVRCPECGHKQVEGRFTGEELSRMYTDFYPRSSMRVEDYRAQQEAKGFFAWLNGARSAAFRWVPRGVRILDVGCGFGEALGYHKARGCDVYGIDADKNILRVGERHGFNVRAGLFGPGVYEPGSFDYVTMNQVIEHVEDPVATLRAAAEVLRPGGTLVLSMPNSNGWGARAFGRRWINWHIPYHLQHFSKGSMGKAAAMAGFRIIEQRTVTSSEWLFYQWLHLMSYPAESVPSAFWSQRPVRSKVKAALFQLAALVHRTKLDHLVTRLFDSLSVGDNFIFVLQKQG